MDSSPLLAELALRSDFALAIEMDRGSGRPRGSLSSESRQIFGFLRKGLSSCLLMYVFDRIDLMYVGYSIYHTVLWSCPSGSN